MLITARELLEQCEQIEWSTRAKPACTMTGEKYKVIFFGGKVCIFIDIYSKDDEIVNDIIIDKVTNAVIWYDYDSKEYVQKKVDNFEPTIEEIYRKFIKA